MSIATQALNTAHHETYHAEHSIDLREHVRFILESRALIASAAIFALTSTIFFLWTASPIFQADAVIQVEEKATPTGEIEELSAFLVGETQTPAEIEILKTRKVLSSVVRQLNLDTIATPIYFPVVGAAISRHLQNKRATFTGDQSTVGKVLRSLGSRYAWGGEHIDISYLYVPINLVGKPLTLVVGNHGQYSLFDDENRHILSGRAGQRADVKEGLFHGTKLYIRELLAPPGVRIRLSKLHRINAIKKLKDELTITELGSQTGIITIRLEGSDPPRLADTVNAIADNYLRQHIDRRSEEASKMLDFLDIQLPELKMNADSTEKALQEHRAKSGSIDLTLEAEQILNKVTDVEKRMSELKLQEPQLERKFTYNHPARKTLEQQLSQLYSLRKSLDKELRALPGTEWETLKLARDAKVANELYVMLLNEAQQLRVAKAGTLGNVRILDRAFVPLEPIKPRKAASLIIALLIGILGGAIIALMRRTLYGTIDDPDQLERALGLPVYVSIPHSELAVKQEKARQRGQPMQLMYLNDKRDYALESLRSLRTSLQFASMTATNNIISVTGPSPQVGKSFICANLAAILGESGKRILLIDADMRRGYLHKYFATERPNGLSEVLSSALDLNIAIRKTQLEKLDFLPNGTFPSNPAELLLSDRFGEMLAYLSERYDVILLDTPPLLAVTDPAIVAKHAGTNLIVLRSGAHALKEIEQALKRIKQIGVVPSGFIINDLPHRPRVYGRDKLSLNNYYYQYDYR
jgi:tyrosine-protein kinase Etk/Wzc